MFLPITLFFFIYFFFFGSHEESFTSKGTSFTFVFERMHLVWIHPVHARGLQYNVWFHNQGIHWQFITRPHRAPRYKKRERNPNDLWLSKLFVHSTYSWIQTWNFMRRRSWPRERFFFFLYNFPLYDLEESKLFDFYS